MALTAATAAFAADLPVNGAATIPAAPAQFSWTGCHIGGHLGGAFRTLTWTDSLGASTSQNSSGFVGGGQIGCDYQFAPSWVLGVEGRAAWTGLKNSTASSVRNNVSGVTVPSQITVTNDFVASATGRLGYSFGNRRVLDYIKGGAAWTSERVEDAFTTLQGVAVDPSSSTTRTGWTVGTGVEWAFASSWSATVAFDYYGFGGKGLTLTAPSAVVTVSSFKDGFGTFTAGVDYRF
jgi:outer membrane immunogenic protein